MVGDTRHIAWRRALAAACLLLAPVAVTESPDHPHYRGLRFPCLPHLGSAPQDLDYSFNRRGDYGGTTSVRTTKASPVKRPVKMLSQLGEDAVLVQHFFHGPRWACQDGPCPYTYLELGANNGVSMSNTMVFQQQGWRGLLIETIPSYCESLKARRCSDVVVCGAVCASRFGGSLDIVDSGASSAAVDMGATKDFVYRWNGGNADKVRARTKRVACAPLSHILARAQLSAVTFFSLDVEGQEHQVLRTIDWTRFSFGVMIIELPCAPNARNGTEAALARTLLRNQGYAFLAFQGGMNEIWYNPHLRWANASAAKVRRSLPDHSGPISRECPDERTWKSASTTGKHKDG